MDQLLMLAALVAATCVLARFAGRLFRADVPLGWPLGRESRERFWQDALPWPHGVQEDTDIAWHVPRAAPPSSQAERREPAARPTPPTRPQPRMTGR
ncbi:MAG TPA: hypothetical protein VFV72_00445 [Candidatus Limnocylindrales bacterium]|nr:hypothetical protein [Candidatus Limnocylindrales bacterium]